MKKTNTILDKIVEKKLQEIEKRKTVLGLKEIKVLLNNLKSNKRDFKAALKKKHLISLIAEIKKASPSLGLIKEDFNPVLIAKSYEHAGASAISILTEKEFFMGNIETMNKIRRATSIPLLRKDFIIDPYQIYESKLYGADAILLIAGILKKEELEELIAVADILNLDTLVEVYSYQELEIAALCNAEIIGINNRNLKTMEVDINHFLNLSRFVAEEKILVCESGIFSRADVMKVKLAGAHAILVGTSLMTAPDIKNKMMELII
ncbi:MAG: indole-3-glycerol phosphate synthase TrpC [Nanoarchaeota archaeon]|nr:indole-3-glycerol phosphate synthase TrpC [Nanoarchaeota archaeon]